jgi:hypothetical protein
MLDVSIMTSSNCLKKFIFESIKPNNNCLNTLYKIKAKENEYPNEIYKVPVKTRFLYHFIMTPLIKMTKFGFNVHDDIYNHTTEYVKAMEARDPEKVTSECGATNSINVKVGCADHIDQLRIA